MCRSRKLGFSVAIFSVLLISVGSRAQSAVPAARTAKGVVIHAGRLLDVKSGNILNNQNIYIEGEKITRVESATAAKREPGWAVIDLSSATVLPGLIDCHVHLTMNPSFGYQELGVSEARQTLIGAKNARNTLMAGFTTVRNVGARGFTDVALRDAINDGDLPGPRMLVSGPPLSITGGHADQNLLPWEYHAQSDGAADGIEGVQHKVREDIKYGADVIEGWRGLQERVRNKR